MCYSTYNTVILATIRMLNLLINDTLQFTVRFNVVGSPRDKLVPILTEVIVSIKSFPSPASLSLSELWL